MIIFQKSAAINTYLSAQKKPTGFVPTMGALHTGHISLIEKCKQENEIAIASIFVNPTQFNDAKDFEKYPVTIEKDIDMLEKVGCDILFLPPVSEVYPDGVANLHNYNLGFIETVLDGKYRPGHFQGVCQVVHRLLTIIQPNSLYLGQKDYQQCMVITKLCELIDADIQIHICPTLREADGLAMSSRNMRLNKTEREKAVKIFHTLCFIKREIKPGYIEDIKVRAVDYLTTEGFKPDYVEIADAKTLKTVEVWDGQQKLVALIAAFLNDVRLIDNMVL